MYEKRLIQIYVDGLEVEHVNAERVYKTESIDEMMIRIIKQERKVLG